MENDWIQHEECSILKEKRTSKVSEKMVLFKLMIFIILFSFPFFLSADNTVSFSKTQFEKRGIFGWECRFCGNWNGESYNCCQYCHRGRGR